MEGLRAIAVLPIILFHFGSTILTGGYVGVDVFFVISGFVIARSITADVDAGRFSVANFYVRRICRLLPALLLLVLLTTVAAVLLLLPEDLDRHFRSVAAVGGFVSNIFFWKSSGYFEAAAQTRPLLHTWSLAVEEQFYLFAPAVLAALYRGWRRYWLPVVLALAAFSFAIAVAQVFVAPKAGYFLLPSRGWELLIGAAIALPSIPWPARRGLREGMALLGAAMIAGSVLALDATSPFPGWNALFPCLGTAFIIQAGSGDDRPPLVNRLLSKAPLRWVGRISYSLYLIHWPIVAFFQYRAMRAPGLAEAGAMLVISLVLAAVSWRFVEEPARRFAHRGAIAGRGRRVLIAGASASLATVALGLAGMTAHGFPARFPDYRPVVIAGAEQWGEPACFTEDQANPLPWNAAACTRVRGARGRTLLWGDSHAAHYVPGLIARARLIDRDVLQYTFSGCPPILAYYSVARLGCSRTNARVPGMIRALHIDHVVLAARWDGVALRTLGRLHETIATLRAMGVRVTVVGQSPLFGAPPQAIDYLSGQYRRPGVAAWPAMTNPQVVAAVRHEARGAAFVDPLRYLCHGTACVYRAGGTWYYADDGHLSAAGATLAVDRFLRAALEAR